MIVQVVYCNHHTAALGLREQLAFASEADLNRAYLKLRVDFPESELVVLSTCNRVEVYTAQEEDHAPPTHDQIARFFSDFHQIPREQFAGQLVAETGEEAVRHLFRVASSVDSMVLGEAQIVNQVKEAYRVAQQNDACGPLTHALFQGAIRVSGRVRSETKLAEGRVSIASVAVGDFGKSIFDRFSDKTVLVIGAGEMAEETLRYLKDEGVGRILIANRSRERGEKLAAEWGGATVAWDDLDRALAEADVIVSTTGSDRPIVDRARFSEVRKQANYKPVFILDLGAPRDFDPAVGDLDDNVFLYDIDDLEATCEKTAVCVPADRTGRPHHRRRDRTLSAGNLPPGDRADHQAAARRVARSARSRSAATLRKTRPSRRKGSRSDRALDRTDRQQTLASAAGNPQAGGPGRNTARPARCTQEAVSPGGVNSFQRSAFSKKPTGCAWRELSTRQSTSQKNSQQRQSSMTNNFAKQTILAAAFAVAVLSIGHGSAVAAELPDPANVQAVKLLEVHTSAKESSSTTLATGTSAGDRIKVFARRQSSGPRPAYQRPQDSGRRNALSDASQHAVLHSTRTARCSARLVVM
jgi:glutamyl-tRNA reductase